MSYIVNSDNSNANSLADKLVAGILEGLEHKYNFDANDTAAMHAIVSSILGAEGRDAPATNKFGLPSAVPLDPVRELDLFSAAPFDSVNQRIFPSALTDTSSFLGNANLEDSYTHDPVHEANALPYQINTYPVDEAVNQYLMLQERNGQVFTNAHDPHPLSGFVYDLSSSPEPAEQHNIASSSTSSEASTEILTSLNRTWYAAAKKAKAFKAMCKTKDGRWTPVATRTPSPYRVSKASDKKAPRARRSCSPSPSSPYPPSPSPSHRARRFADVVEFDLMPGEQALPSIECAFDDKLVGDNEDGSQASSVSSTSSVSDSSETTLVDDEFDVDPGVGDAGVGSPRGILKSVSPCRSVCHAGVERTKVPERASGMRASILGNRSATVEVAGEGAEYGGRGGSCGGSSRTGMRCCSI
ncbi:hypothetical protein IQ07DRAFT_654230 [Pyrenochaeta sp. DS3sAY3a]|nr:hypothetical protein IQ07DRAFT_654230 [Pyrenochaeta sp. DS3sAY3a]